MNKRQAITLIVVIVVVVLGVLIVTMGSAVLSGMHTIPVH
jgi:hypothetical protein